MENFIFCAVRGEQANETVRAKVYEIHSEHTCDALLSYERCGPTS